MNAPRLLLIFLLSSGIARAQAQGNPAPAPAQTEMQKWIADTDAVWQATYKRDVTDPYTAELDKLKIQYLTSIEAGITKASSTGDLDGSVALSKEKKRFAETNEVPAQDEAADLPAVKQLRTGWRTQIAKMEKDRAVRVKALHAKYDASLAQAQTQLTQRKRFEDALLVKAKRAEVAAAWLAGVPSVPPPTVAVEQPKPPPVTPVKPPAGQKPAKIDEKALAAKLIEMGCEVNFDRGDGKKYPVEWVKFGRRDWTEEDFAICDQLANIRELLIITNSATDAMMERARACRKVTKLLVGDLPNITGKGIQFISSMPELKFAELSKMTIDDASLKTAFQGSKVERLVFASVEGLTDPSFATLAELPSLQNLRFNGLKGFTAANCLSLSKARKLNHLEIVQCNSPGTDGIANLAKCRTLDALYIRDTPVTDEDLKPLLAMKQLRTLGVRNTEVTTTFLASLRTALPKLKIEEEGKRQ